MKIILKLLNNLDRVVVTTLETKLIKAAGLNAMINQLQAKGLMKEIEYKPGTGYVQKKVPDIIVRPHMLFQYKGKGNEDLIVRIVTVFADIINYKFVKEHNLRAKMNASVHTEKMDKFLKHYKPYVKK